MFVNSGFSEEEAMRYTTGDCHLLSWYIYQKIVYCNYHDFSNNYGIYLLKNKGVVIHSLVYHDSYFFDITGRYDAPEEIYDYWASCYPEYSGANKEFFTLEVIDPQNPEERKELDLNAYDDEDQKQVQFFANYKIRQLLHLD